MALTIYISTLIFALIGISFAVWTFFDTRKKYYNDFLKRKSEREKLHLP
jgi:hypothetical protein